jgi:hypothetical protein
MMTAQTLDELRQDLKKAPVMGAVHPLIPLCLPPGTEVTGDATGVSFEIDNLSPHRERDLLITQVVKRYKQRFLIADVRDVPPAEEVNSMFPYRLKCARDHLLTHRLIADHITNDARQNHYQVVVLLLVDGLSYHDTLGWSEKIDPCFVDGPSITFDKSEEKKVLRTVGFPAIVGDPPLVRRLSSIGLSHAYGFSYWDRDNDVTEVLFRGIPLDRVDSIQYAVAAMHNLDVSGHYIQVLREGLDGLAHKRREVSLDEIEATVNAVRNDMLQLVEVIQSQDVCGAIYLVSDHGILWTTHHKMERVPALDRSASRYGDHPLSNNRSSRIRCEKQIYHVYHYPYVGRKVPSNDCGVHGGLSYWESIVPFVHIEVIP